MSNTELTLRGLRAAEFLALHTQKDMDWKRELSNSKTRDDAIRALDAELASLQSTVLTTVHADNPEYEQVLELACAGCITIARKRIECYKARRVKPGFKEDKLLADGHGFNYYSHTANFISIRAVLFRKGRGNCRITINDVKVAYV